LYFPAFTAHFPAESRPVRIIPRGQGQIILLAEDNPTVREVTQSMLESLNYRVLAAKDGVEALSAYRSQPDEIALVLTDAVMPEMDGYALAAALQTEAPDLPVLLFSGYAQNMEIPPEIAQIVVSRLQKPLNIQELARALDKVLRKR
jgi:two-component system cell cycle sensor histidine kinase/response regulator CckA